MGSNTKLEYPLESFPTLQPAFVVKVSGITNKFAAGPVHASGGLFAVVCLGLSLPIEGRRGACMLIETPSSPLKMAWSSRWATSNQR